MPRTYFQQQPQQPWLQEELTPATSENLRFGMQRPVTLGGAGSNISSLPVHSGQQSISPSVITMPVQDPGLERGFTSMREDDLGRTWPAAPAWQPTTKPMDPKIVAAQIATSNAERLRVNPLLDDMSEADLARSQVNRDPTGTAAKILAALQGVTPTMQSTRPIQSIPYQGPVDERTVMASREHTPTLGNFLDVPTTSASSNLKPYVPEGGLDAPDAEGIDKRILNLPLFKRLLQTDPEKAAFAYKAIKGRDLESDMKANSDIVRNREKFQFDLASNLIKNGAEVDKSTGKLMKWSTSMPEGEGVSSLNADQRPIRRWMEATEDEVQAYDAMYPRLMGRANPMRALKGEFAKNRNFGKNNAMLKEPAIAAAIAAEEKKNSGIAGKNITLTAEEKAIVARDIIRMQGNVAGTVPEAYKNYWSNLGAGASEYGSRVWDQISPPPADIDYVRPRNAFGN